MLSYALGRGVEPDDLPTIRKITVKNLDARKTTMRDVLVTEIVKSYPFRNRSSVGFPDDRSKISIASGFRER